MTPAAAATTLDPSPPKEDQMSKQLAYAAIAGIAIAQLGWIDPLFIPLVLAGPIITGAVAATRGIRLPLVAVAWAAAGITMLVEDWVINHEDVAFHAALTVVMAALAAAAWTITARLGRRRANATA
jgi:hypothetical protein